MWRSISILTLSTLTATIALAGQAFAETVRLRTGQTLMGDLRLEGDDAIVLDQRFPTVGVVHLKRSDLAPESLYDVLERRTDAADAAKRLALGETAEKLGLSGAAIAEYRRVRSLDPASATEMDRRVVRLEEEVATDALDDAKDLLEEGMANAALMRLHALLEIYPGTKAAKLAQALLVTAEKAAGASAEVAVRTVAAADAVKLADEIEAGLRKGDAAAAKVSGHEGTGGTADVRSLLRAIDLYEDAWKDARRLPAGTNGTAELDDRFAKLRARAKASLVRAYLDAGSVLLQRRSIPSAERMCDKACELDPQHKDLHALHRLILEAKATSWRGRGAPVGR